jgi:predicted small integral membrane protein
MELMLMRRSRLAENALRYNSSEKETMPMRRWAVLETTLAVGGVLVGLNALYMTLVAVGNITDFDVNRQFVHHVLSMDTTNFGQPQGTALDSAIMWRALNALPLQTAVYVGIIAWELAAAVVLVIALVLWMVDRSACKRNARSVSTIGLLMVVLLFFGGFIDIGGEWFQMWRSSANNGLDPAFRNVVLAVMTLWLIQLPTAPTKEQRVQRE